MSEDSTTLNKFTDDEKNKIQALKNQLTWKSFNYSAGKKFRIQVNPLKRTHTLYFPKDPTNNPSFEHYIIELTRCFYAESYDGIFGDPYFDPDSDKDYIELVSNLIETSIHWFCSAFCNANWPQAWSALLAKHYEFIQQNPTIIEADFLKCLKAAMVIGQIAINNKQNSDQLIQGKLQKLVNAFLVHDPKKVTMVSVASLVSTLAGEFVPRDVEYLSTKHGGFWKIHPKSE